MAIQQQTQQQSMPTYYVAKQGCTFCGVMGHFMKECRTVEQYMREGKVQRNHANRLIIGTGAEIPEAKGRPLKELVDEWHRAHPNQTATGVLSSNANPTEQMIYSIAPSSARTFHYEVPVNVARTAPVQSINAVQQPRNFLEAVEMPPRILTRSAKVANAVQGRAAVPAPVSTPAVVVTPPAPQAALAPPTAAAASRQPQLPISRKWQKRKQR
ncbi:hypothetical protein BD779DRAFT_1482375 [Infundibulicybe gibba]|nr:hypothetical protein BD779DRAFT_1482375 [Infundibulicybe gibba]